MTEKTRIIDGAEFAKAYSNYSEAVTDKDNRAVFRTQAYNYTNNTSNITVRNREDRHSQYPQNYQLTQTQIENIVGMCMDAYNTQPIVSNIVDLMSEFGSQGVRIVCSDKRQEKFGQEWAEYVGLPERSERFINVLLRAGTIVVKRTDGKVPLKIQKKWKSTVANGEHGNPKEVVNITEKDTGKTAVMPLKWTYYDPRQVVMVGGILNNFIGKPVFGLRINQELRNEIYQLSSVTQKQSELEDFKKMIPDYVMKAINDNALFFPLDQSKISAYYYKKDDWDLWGRPLVLPILGDLQRLNKLKDCDSAALDGAMSSVRLWTVGDLELGIVPGKEALNKVRDIIADAKPGSVTDIIWGPDLKFQESNSNLHQWLTPQKYDATLSSIYAGLGVPPGLTGSSGSSSFTNNNISLKTLIERLKYVRSILISFLQEQLALVQKAMGFTKKFYVVFDQMVLSDEAAEKTLLLQLVDRDIISAETLRFALDIDHNDVEESKIRRENRRQGNSMPPKASQFHNPEKEHDLKKLAIQKGGVTPSQVGMDLPEKKKGEKTFFESSTPKDKLNKPKGSTLNGRPKNSGDKKKRKAKRVLPRGSSANFQELFRYAESAQLEIERLVNPVFLAVANKKNVRSLTNDETERLEALKFRVFSNIEPYSKVNEEQIKSIAQANKPVDNEFYTLYLQNVYILTEKYGRELTVAEKRNISCETFAELFSE